jgi:hypothetical protein
MGLRIVTPIPISSGMMRSMLPSLWRHICMSGLMDLAAAHTRAQRG